MQGKLERLQGAGIAVAAKEPYLTVADELSEPEVDALISATAPR